MEWLFFCNVLLQFLTFLGFFYFCIYSSTLLPWPWASDASLFAPFWKLPVGHRWHRQSTCTGNGIGWDCPASSQVVSCNIKMIFVVPFFKWLANLYSSLRSEHLHVTQCSWIFFFFLVLVPLWGHLSLRSKVWLLLTYSLDVYTFCAEEE